MKKSNQIKGMARKSSSKRKLLLDRNPQPTINRRPSSKNITHKKMRRYSSHKAMPRSDSKKEINYYKKPGYTQMKRVSSQANKIHQSRKSNGSQKSKAKVWNNRKEKESFGGNQQARKVLPTKRDKFIGSSSKGKIGYTKENNPTPKKPCKFTSCIF